MSHRLALLLVSLSLGCVPPNVDGTPTDDAGDSTDDAGGGSADLAGADLAGKRPPDLAGAPPADMTQIQVGPIGPKGGAVDLLYFGFHGDTRPMNCNDTANYPTAIIQNIYKREAALPLQFTVSLGDYMFVCGAQEFKTANDQVGIYLAASKLFGKMDFLVMGNHECEASGTCLVGAKDPNSLAFYAALKPISPLPYYSFDITTRAGLATFVVVADNAWDANQQNWLTATLTKADAAAKYTIVMRHHPIDNVDLPTNMTSWGIIKAHKTSLFLTGHTHEYKRDTWNDPSGRTIVMGAGGAPFDGGGTFYGFGTVQQQMDGRLAVSIIDQQTGNIRDSFSVTPQ